ncbi:hypothetical protein B0H14DRAFT_3444828 [Mycena olivaceomarginata]|nr:hypothetical protein B0H14DRAFT_3444828 [Mycena olivaceomarginata]
MSHCISLEILAKLTNVQHCVLDGCFEGFYWHNFTPSLASYFLDLFARQPLQKLQLLSILEIPVAVFLQLLGAAPMVLLSALSIKDGLDDFPADIPIVSTPESLLLELEFEFGTRSPVSATLARSELAPYLQNVRRLGIRPHWPHSLKILTLTVLTIQHLRLHCHSTTPTSLHDDVLLNSFPDVSTIALPPLPALTSVEFVLTADQQKEPWLIEAIGTSHPAPVLCGYIWCFSLLDTRATLVFLQWPVIRYV